jgi:hypothetical protein
MFSFVSDFNFKIFPGINVPQIYILWPNCHSEIFWPGFYLTIRARALWRAPGGRAVSAFFNPLPGVEKPPSRTALLT